MANIRDRIGRLELRVSGELDRHQIEMDAAEVTKRLLRSAASFDEAAATMPIADRLALSPAEHCAWAMRFTPADADPRNIMALHGRF